MVVSSPEAQLAALQCGGTARMPHPHDQTIPGRHLADVPGHHPMVLSDLPITLEPVALEERNGCVVEQSARNLPPSGLLRIALHEATPQPGDLVERASEGGVRRTPMTVSATYEEARDAPLGQEAQIRVVRLTLLDPRELVGRPELAPPNALGCVVDERSMRPPFSAPGFLEPAALLRSVQVRGALLVEAEAPAPTPDPVVVLTLTSLRLRRMPRPGRHFSGRSGASKRATTRTCQLVVA